MREEGTKAQRHKGTEKIIPDLKPLLRRRDLVKIGITECTIRKMEANGIIRRVYPAPGHGYYLRHEIETAIRNGSHR